MSTKSLRIFVVDFSTGDFQEKLQKCFDVREAVDQRERGIPYAIDRDGLDYDVRHVNHLGVGYRGASEYVGTLRLEYWEKNVAQIHHLAMRQGYRHERAEEKLLQAAERRASHLQKEKLSLTVRADDGVQFYLDRGFTRNRDPFVGEDHITYHPLQKVLPR